MNRYTLASDEVYLYQGTVTTPGEAQNIKLVLTNLHLTLIQEDGNTAKHPVAEIKIYKDVPQIFLKNHRVDIFLTTGEIEIEFKNWLEATRFTDTALELLTGKTKLARNAGKVKKALDDVNDAFGVNILEEAKNFGVDTISHIAANTKPSVFKIFSKKKNKKQTKKLKE